jgi:hypothetical protein
MINHISIAANEPERVANVPGRDLGRTGLPVPARTRFIFCPRERRTRHGRRGHPERYGAHPG